MAIYEQKLTDLNDGKGGVALTNKVDLRDALDAVEISKIVGNTINQGKSDEKQIMFAIPQELWTLDPTLRLATFYRSVGEEAKYVAQIRKWTKENPRLCMEHERRFF
mgnify:CR=1 FL=1|jgi:hypothetical protein